MATYPPSQREAYQSNMAPSRWYQGRVQRGGRAHTFTGNSLGTRVLHARTTCEFPSGVGNSGRGRRNRSLVREGRLWDGGSGGRASGPCVGGRRGRERALHSPIHRFFLQHRHLGGTPTWGLGGGRARHSPRRHGQLGPRHPPFLPCRRVRPPPFPPQRIIDANMSMRWVPSTGVDGCHAFGGGDGGRRTRKGRRGGRAPPRRVRPISHWRCLPPGRAGQGGGRGRARNSTEHSRPCRRKKVVFFRNHTSAGQTTPPWDKPHLRGTNHTSVGQTTPPRDKPHLRGTNHTSVGQTTPPWDKPHLRGTNHTSLRGKTTPPPWDKTTPVGQNHTRSVLVHWRIVRAPDLSSPLTTRAT